MLSNTVIMGEAGVVPETAPATGGERGPHGWETWLDVAITRTMID
jgi:hypothetical protein